MAQKKSRKRTLAARKFAQFFTTRNTLKNESSFLKIEVCGRGDS